MENKTNYIVFKKGDLAIQINDETLVPVPEYVERAIKTYRFNTSDSMLEKRCHTCKKWFAVERLVDGEWQDIHSESKYHFASPKSGYGSYCRECSDDRVKEQKVKTNTNTKNIKEGDDKDEEEAKIKEVVLLKPENRQYMQLRLAIDDTKKNAFINWLIEEERRRKPIEVSVK